MKKAEVTFEESHFCRKKHRVILSFHLFVYQTFIQIFFYLAIHNTQLSQMHTPLGATGSEMDTGDPVAEMLL